MVESTDVRSAAERAEAKRVAASERKLADDMRRDRLADEAANGNRGAANLGGSAAAPVETAARPHSKPTKRTVKVVTKKRKKKEKAPAN